MSVPPPTFVTAVVDDDRRVLESLEDLLESAGHRVRLYGTAAALLDSGSLADIDCLICDIDLPAIDGFELLRRASASRPGLPVILITGHAEIARRPPAGAARCYRLFEKPFDGREMLTAVADALIPARAAFRRQSTP